MLYTKYINNRQVFSECHTIQTNDGLWISNPSEQQILDAGWQIYEPPEQPIIEQVSTQPNIEQILDAVKIMLNSQTSELSDEEALAVAALYPTWISKEGQSVSSGLRLWYNDKLYKVIQTHIVQQDWTPDVTSALFTEVSIQEFPEWVQPQGAHDAYNTGDKVIHNGVHYISTVDANIWEPGVYGWEVI